MAEGSSFRGYWAIREVIDRMDPLVDWTKQFKPQQRHVTLPRKDFDLIRRWPKAASVLNIDVHESDVMYKGLELTYDGGPRRYGERDLPQQTDIEGDHADREEAGGSRDFIGGLRGS